MIDEKKAKCIDVMIMHHDLHGKPFEAIQKAIADVQAQRQAKVSHKLLLSPEAFMAVTEEEFQSELAKHHAGDRKFQQLPAPARRKRVVRYDDLEPGDSGSSYDGYVDAKHRRRNGLRY